MKDSLVSARQSKVTFDIASEIVVIGSHHEMADISNPDGFIYDTAYYVIAVYPNGECLRHHKNFFDPNAAERFHDKVEKANWFNLRYWGDHRPIYGSAAYEANMEEELALERKEDLGYDSSWGKDRLASDGFTVIKWNQW